MPQLVETSEGLARVEGELSMRGNKSVATAIVYPAQAPIVALDVLRCNLEAGNVLTAGVLGEQLWQSMFVSGLLSGHWSRTGFQKASAFCDRPHLPTGGR